jgi:hypothetical protein
MDSAPLRRLVAALAAGLDALRRSLAREIDLRARAALDNATRCDLGLAEDGWPSGVAQ